MQFRNFLILTTLLAQAALGAPLNRERSNIIKVSQTEINQILKKEAMQIQSGLRALELNKELSVNHFTREQLIVVKKLAQQFIQCAKQSLDVQKCAPFREKMNMIDDNGRFVTSIGEKDTPSLIGPGDVLSGIGDSLDMMNNQEALSAEYAEILKSLPKSSQRGLPNLSQFSRLKPTQMQGVLNRQIYPLVEKLIDLNITPNKTPSSEDKWNAQTKCEDAIGYSYIDSDTTDNAYRCDYSQLDENGILKNKEFPLKYFTPCIKAQKSRGTCSSFAVVGALEIRLLKNRKQEYNLSEQFTYFYNEIYGGWWGRYQYGVTTVNALKDLKNKSLSIPLEKHWVYNPGYSMEDYDSSTKKHPKSCVDYNGQKCTNYAFQSGESRSGLNYTYTVPSKPKPHVKVNSRYSFWNPLNPKGALDTAINYLNNGDPIIVAFKVKENFRSKGGGDNYVKYAKRSGGGGHASVLVGFVRNEDLPAGAEKATEKGFFILRNSWGGKWADCGHIYVDYKYMQKYASGLARITYNLQN